MERVTFSFDSPHPLLLQLLLTRYWSAVKCLYMLWIWEQGWVFASAPCQQSAWTARSRTDFLWTSPAAIEHPPSPKTGRSQCSFTGILGSKQMLEIFLSKALLRGRISSHFGTHEHQEEIWAEQAGWHPSVSQHGAISAGCWSSGRICHTVGLPALRKATQQQQQPLPPHPIHNRASFKHPAPASTNCRSTAFIEGMLNTSWELPLLLLNISEFINRTDNNAVIQPHSWTLICQLSLLILPLKIWI